MTGASELIKLYARSLKLPTVARYEEVVRQAEEQGWGYAKFLATVLAREISHREESSLKRRLHLARFPLQKSLDDFDFRVLPQLEEALVWQLATGEFVERRENIIMIGNPGTGKTHITIGLGRRLCQKGYKVRFYTAANLVLELGEAQQEKRLGCLERTLAKVDVLIVDELSYLTFSRPQAELLFHVLSERAERGSVIVTIMWNIKLFGFNASPLLGRSVVLEFGLKA
ncbi:MAG: IS21-like element helper ATPase IstB [Bacillota bacterium]